MSCLRCEAINCRVGTTEQHLNTYQLPPSPCSLDDTPIRYMGEWCECCLGRVWDNLDPVRREFLRSMALSSPRWIVRPTGCPNNRGFSVAVKLAGVGVFFGENNVPGEVMPRGGGDHGRWGWPFAYDESVTPKTHHIPKDGAQVLLAVLEARGLR